MDIHRTKGRRSNDDDSAESRRPGRHFVQERERAAAATPRDRAAAAEARSCAYAIGHALIVAGSALSGERVEPARPLGHCPSRLTSHRGGSIDGAHASPRHLRPILSIDDCPGLRAAPVGRRHRSTPRTPTRTTIGTRWIAEVRAAGRRGPDGRASTRVSSAMATRSCISGPRLRHARPAGRPRLPRPPARRPMRTRSSSISSSSTPARRAA